MLISGEGTTGGPLEILQLRHWLKSFNTLFRLKLAYLVFSAAEQLSINLQAKDSMMNEGLITAHVSYSS